MVPDWIFKSHATCGVAGYSEPLGDIVLSNEGVRQVANRDQVGCAMMLPTQNGVNDSDLSTKEPCDAKVSRPVRKWRGGR